MAAYFVLALAIVAYLTSRACYAAPSAVGRVSAFGDDAGSVAARLILGAVAGAASAERTGVQVVASPFAAGLSSRASVAARPAVRVVAVGINAAAIAARK